MLKGGGGCPKPGRRSLSSWLYPFHWIYFNDRLITKDEQHLLYNTKVVGGKEWFYFHFVNDYSSTVACIYIILYCFVCIFTNKKQFYAQVDQSLDLLNKLIDFIDTCTLMRYMSSLNLESTFSFN